MAYEYIADHTAVNYSPGNSGRKYIVIHYTGNDTDSDEGNANYFRDLYRGASAHLFVDDDSVHEVVSLTDSSWAVGVNISNGRLFGVCTNYNSINVEMCSRDGKITNATLDNTVVLTKNLMSQFDIDADHVVRHYDVCGKRCPGWTGWLPGDESLWNLFQSRIRNDVENVTGRKGEDEMRCFYTIDGVGGVYYFDGFKPHALSHPDEMKAINEVYKANNGKDMPSFKWTKNAPWYTRLIQGTSR